MKSWDHRVFCPCGHNDEHYGGDPALAGFWYKNDVCPRCATRGDRWRVFTVRWVSKAKLWAPWTWGRGYWEVDTGEGRKPLTEVWPVLAGKEAIHAEI
ncbi:hypothetical protein phiCbK_289 [Caulobacter phage phiCbK]|uniref:Uncharacterized protein n=5 Tax=Viruses TaxID=10239 RepID=J3SMQ0_9CAUD|nr:hypothetical protein D865_gp030 [Caulobacter phage phiCbK]AFO71805.1 hypothetical protein phiCbK_289 [Caulobacter phage phiCbK]AFU86862.1 hypothetical protein CbK_gp030 [Caulobacter phage phiCbK]ARB14949.1 hypothetical protein Ccr32_gp030 [Caulobacter phage Ccr32]ARB15280.1 hypothetical protein Ccr34_gp031 [Caulobacter phage Ccr34]